MRGLLRVVPGRSTGSNERDAGNRVGYRGGTPDPLDDCLVRVGEQGPMREYGSAADLDIFAVTARRERMRLDGAINQTVRLVARYRIYNQISASRSRVSSRCCCWSSRVVLLYFRRRHCQMTLI